MAHERDQLRIEPQLRYLFLELTDACNLHCRHCGSGCEMSPTSFLDTEAIQKTIVSAVTHEPKVHIVLTGGEPYMHPAFSRIVRFLGKTGALWSVVTNATLIDSDAADLLKKNGIYSVSVSLDGDESDHNLLRQSESAYVRAMRGIDVLCNKKIRLQITTVVTKQTVSKLESIENIVRSTGAVSWKLLNIEPIGRALTNNELLLNRKELFRLFDFICEKRSSAAAHTDALDVTYGCSHFLPLMYEEAVRTTPFICGAGIMIAGIRCNGDISGCLDIERRPELVQGNVRRDDFWAVWRDRYQFFRRDRTGESDRCRDCKMRTLCGGDSLHTWDFDRKEPRMCMFTVE